MQKHSIIIGAACLGVLLTISSIAAREYKNSAELKVFSASKGSTSSPSDISVNTSQSLQVVSEVKETDKIKAVDKDYLYSVLEVFGEAPKKEDIKFAKQPPKTVAIQPKTKTIALSRGGNPPVKSTVKKSTTSLSRGSAPGKSQLLDWWKQANSAFPIGSVATVRDVYTGKTFKIKRTMGANHADCEALTKADTAIIKSIWGGFNWNVRPVHVIVSGRVLAASMSSMAHAGVDSKPAWVVVDNRSGGYGTGENLDAVKGNGMDGHFDIHFLNSTRHKDGQVDARHQSAIKIAASR